LITVVGAGLAGSLLALELAERGLAVRLIEAGTAAGATALSYGLLPWSAGRAWRRLQRRHGDLGLRQRWLQLGPRGVPLPALQVDGQRFAAAMPPILEALGVERLPAQPPLAARTPVVLACGAGCRALAPHLEARLRVSWAGILELEPGPAGAWLGWRQGLAQLPQRFGRQALERRAPELQQEAWVVDGGLVPCGDRLLAGQISLIRPGLEAGQGPDAAVMEQRLRSALAAQWPDLATAPGQYRQCAVSFCTNGRPLAGPCGPDQWVLAGFSGAFAQVPDAAHGMADQLAAKWAP
jgi:glycine/D-amino acid oxidase-like deaminating enzyme